MNHNKAVSLAEINAQCSWLVGYERVSTDGQNLALQHVALQTAGCEKIFSDTMSGANADRPGLKEAFEFAQKRDTITV